MENSNQRLGRLGEDAAARWYVAAGYQLLDRNWRCDLGEVDLIVGREAMVAFVEVKTRSSRRYGSGFDAVDWRKQNRIRRVALSWLAETRRPDSPVSPDRYFTEIRFDVVDVDARGNVQVNEGCF